MKNIFQKSALALTVAAISTSAFAGDLVYTNSGLPTATNGAGNHPIVLATEVFGSGSAATLVATPDLTYEVDVTKNAIGAGEVATVKLTLNKDAVFGENLSLIDNWAASNATLVFEFGTEGTVTVGDTGPTYTQNANINIVVDSGGEIGDNTIVFKITSTGVETLESVQVAQFRTKGLTSALAGTVADAERNVSLAAEFRNEDTTETDTQEAIVIFESQPVLTLRADNITNYLASPGLRSRINVASDEELFTNLVGTAAASDFDTTGDLDYVQLGELYIERTMAYGEFVAKENGAPFDWNGSDVFEMTVETGVSMDAYDNLHLVPMAPGVDCTDAGETLSGLAGLTSVLELDGQDTDDLESGYLVCATVDGDEAIPESTLFEIGVTVDYFNPRYVPSESNVVDFGAILRNGCSVTLFNVPNAGSPDKAFIRLTNVSANSGRVSAYGYDEAGNLLTEADLDTVIPAHGTVVFHTDAANSSGVYLGDALPDFGDLTSGRARIVLKGGFPACEALGLIRTPANVLTNMTSTTYAGDEARFGEKQNGTSNTAN